MAQLLLLAWVFAASPSAGAPEDASTLLADLGAEVRARLPAEVHGLDPPAQLEAVLSSGTPYEFDTGAVVARTDARWFSALPEDGAGAPLVELHRWPGDTVLAVYAVDPPDSGERMAAPPIRAASFAPPPVVHDGWIEWRGSVETELGPRPALWIERRVPEGRAWLGALLLPGDAGLGAGAVESLTAELLAVVRRLAVRAPVWKVREAIARDAVVAIPPAGMPPGTASELDLPWQVAETSTFTVGLPPGFRARRTDVGVAPPVEVPGSLLWLRGRFVDAHGTLVAVGDGLRAGYVAEVRPPVAAWLAGERPPAGAGTARRLAAEPFNLAREHTGARGARAERWAEEGFAGQWLVFRLPFKDRGVEIGLPVLAGRQSPSLYWIPLSWRAAGHAPAPPPVDPAERFGIRFEQLSRTAKLRQPWVEGYLTVPGMRCELPDGIWPSAALRSANGFPIRLIRASGAALGQLDRLESDAWPARVAEGWVELPRPAAQGALRLFARQDDARLYVARAGHAFLFEPLGETSEPVAWKRLQASVRLVRSPG